MRIAKVRFIVSLIIVVAVVTFVLFSTKGKDVVRFGAFGGVTNLSVRVVILLSLAVGFVLGYLFRITRFVRKKAPKKSAQ